MSLAFCSTDFAHLDSATAPLAPLHAAMGQNALGRLFPSSSSPSSSSSSVTGSCPLPLCSDLGAFHAIINKLSENSPFLTSSSLSSSLSASLFPSLFLEGTGADAKGTRSFITITIIIIIIIMTCFTSLHFCFCVVLCLCLFLTLTL